MVEHTSDASEPFFLGDLAVIVSVEGLEEAVQGVDVKFLSRSMQVYDH